MGIRGRKLLPGSLLVNIVNLINICHRLISRKILFVFVCGIATTRFLFGKSVLNTSSLIGDVIRVRDCVFGEAPSAFRPKVCIRPEEPVMNFEKPAACVKRLTAEMGRLACRTFAGMKMPRDGEGLRGESGRPSLLFAKALRASTR